MMDIHERITKEDIDQIAVDMEKARAELNRMGGSFTTVNHIILQLSEKLDKLIVKHTKVNQRYKKQKPLT